MELDQLLTLTSVVASKLLPIMGVVALIFLVILFRRMIVLLNSSKTTIETMNTALENANRQLDALDKPMQTIHGLSDTIDNVHEASKNVMRSTLVALIDNIGNVMQAFNKDKGQAQTDEDVEKTMRGEEVHE